jgi:SAM-dependent MidA family methyltransferase
VPPLVDLLASRIARRGPLPFDEVMEAALYDPRAGFYATGGAAGRRGDFVTSPEVGPLFGALVARALDGWWTELGRPDPFVVVEAGAGRGALARSVLSAGPECASALRYLLVEQSEALRARHHDHLDIVGPAFAFGPPLPDDDDDGPSAPTADGPVVVSLADLPSVDGPVVVLANELLDNLAFRVLERGTDGWLEVRAAADAWRRIDVDSTPKGSSTATGGRMPAADSTSGGDAVPGSDAPSTDDSTGLVELLVPAGERLAAYADRLVTDVPVGARIPVQDAAAGWLRRALDTAGRGGRVVLLDYAATTTMLAHRPWTDWLRTYAGHERGGHPFERLGQQDITADVCVDQLARVRPLTSDRTQADWLGDLGIEELVDEGRRTWTERAHLGDLAALRARSRITEADALLDPGGLGGFRVLEWTT